MQALADGKINFIVECSPLLGPQLMDLVKKVKAGETVPKRIVTEETTFTQEQAKAALPDPQVLSRHRDRGLPGGSASRTPVSPPGSATGATGRPVEHTAPVLQMRGIGKQFPGVKALDGVDFRLFPGEVHALMGENGAGKSTLIKVLTGVYASTPATIGSTAAGRVHRPAARRSGPASAPSTRRSTSARTSRSRRTSSSAASRAGSGGSTGATMRRRADRAAARGSDLDIDVTAPLSTYSLAIQQMVAIARAIDIDAKVLILDEPTSSLDAGEVAQLFRVMRRLKERGHRDRVRLALPRPGLRDHRPHHRPAQRPAGRRVRTSRARQVGAGRQDDRPGARDARRARASSTRRERSRSGARAAGAARPRRSAARARSSRSTWPSTTGEVVGLAGLLGSGRTELARLLFGADRADTGTLYDRRQAGDAAQPARGDRRRRSRSAPENRKTEGLVDDLTVRENIILALQAARGWTRPIPRRRQDELVAQVHRGARHPPGRTRSAGAEPAAAATSRRCCSPAG